ncbi:MAG: response regulator [Acidobacteriota bacterium]
MRRFVILVADDDEDDCMLLSDAFKEKGNHVDLRFVGNGQELLDYLHRLDGHPSDEDAAPCPDLILLDLNMPTKDGREALKEIKADPKLRRIPVVILTTSREERDILLMFDLGASSFISKPFSFDDWRGLVEAISSYWFKFSTLPPVKRKGC